MSPRRHLTIAALAAALAIAPGGAGAQVSVPDQFPLRDARRITRAVAVAADLVAQTGNTALVRVSDLDALATRVFEANRRAHFEEALSLAQLIASDAEGRQTVDVLDAGGYAAIRLGRSREALELLDQARDLADDLDPRSVWRHAWIARAALDAGHPDVAVAAADAVVRAAPGVPIEIEARFNAARARLQIEPERSAAIDTLDSLLVTYPEYPQLARLVVELAAASLAEGRPTETISRLDALVFNRPFSPYAEDAGHLVHDAIAAGGTSRAHSVDARIERAAQLRRQRHWDIAEAEFVRLIDEVSSADDRGRIRFERALNFYDAARFAEAQAELETIEDEGRAGVSSYEWHKWMGRTLSRLGREEDAWNTFRAYYGDSVGTSGHQQLAEFARDLGMWDRAIEHSRAVEPPGFWRSFDGIFLNYLAGNFVDAERAFVTLAASSEGVSAHRARYWQARTLVQLGRVDDAIAVYEQLAEGNQPDWYQILARSRLAEWRPALLERQAGALSAEPMSRTGRVHWDGPGAPGDAALSDVERTDPDVLFGDRASLFDDAGATHLFADTWGELFPEARVAAALVDIGALEEARVELRDVVLEFRVLDRLFDRGRELSERRPIDFERFRWAHYIDNRSAPRGWWGVSLSQSRWPIPRGDALTEWVDRHREIRDHRDEIADDLLAAMREVGENHFVRQHAYAESGFARSTPSGDARADWSMAFPQAWPGFMERYARPLDLNPLLIWSLMIVESDLNPDSVSTADAYGLMQVIPKTADLVARDTGAVDLGVHDLVDPEIAIRYGTWYLAELLEKFNGQEALALVSYNAGPHQVARWLDWRGDLDLDAFIETVPFEGARRYPQRILRYMALYRWTWCGTDELYIGNDLDPDYRDNIYY